MKLFNFNKCAKWLIVFCKWLFFVFINDELCKVLKFAINEIDGDFL